MFSRSPALQTSPHTHTHTHSSPLPLLPLTIAWYDILPPLQATLVLGLGSFVMVREFCMRASPARTWGGWSWQAFRGWSAYLTYALPSVAMICCEWWTFEAGAEWVAVVWWFFGGERKQLLGGLLGGRSGEGGRSTGGGFMAPGAGPPEVEGWKAWKQAVPGSPWLSCTAPVQVGAIDPAACGGELSIGRK